MQVDFSVELGRDDPTLEIPWSSPDGVILYQNVKLNPGALEQIPEAADYPELRQFLAEINAPGSKLESAKCDVWSTTEISPEEEIFGAPWKFASYVDLLFTSLVLRESFPYHEQFLKALTAAVRTTCDAPALVDFVLRRCFTQDGEAVRTGFYFTSYIFGYGLNEPRARENWSTALASVAHALLRTLPAPVSPPL